MLLVQWSVGNRRPGSTRLGSTMKRWTKTSFSTGPPIGQKPSVDDVPPAVAAARARIGWASNHSENEVRQAARDRSPRLEREDSLFRLTESRLVFHSGEALVRNRPDAPWVPAEGALQRKQRGSVRAAVEIASDPRLISEACQAYDALVFAPGTSSSKNALYSTWKKISEARGLQALLLTVEQVKVNVAIFLRSAGYRAIKSFLYEAKDRTHQIGLSMDSTAADFSRRRQTSC